MRNIFYSLLVLVSLDSTAQVAVRFSAIQSNWKSIDESQRKPVGGIGLGLLWRKYISNDWFGQPEIYFSRLGGTLEWENGDFITTKANYLGISAPIGYVLKKNTFGLKLLTGPRLGIGNSGKFRSQSQNQSYDGTIEFENKINNLTRGFYPGGIDIYFLRPFNFEWTFEFTFHYQAFGLSLASALGINNLYPKRSDISVEDFYLRTRTHSISLIYYMYNLGW